MKSRLLGLLGINLVALTAAWAGGGKWTLLGWNNLGMHCMDDDYQVFSILPPFNTVNAQLLNADGKLVKSPAGISLTFEALADPSGSINTTSVGKTNFWETAQWMYGSTLTTPDVGLTGVKMPGPTNIPQPFAWGGSPVLNWFEATGVPITPVDDAGNYNAYPLMRLKARNASGTLLAQADVVLPVSSEMDCRACHASGAGPAARPAAGWENDANSKHDFRYNILKLHDEKHAGAAEYVQALITAAYRPEGLYATAKGGVPILCAECHKSEALPGSGIGNIAPLTQSMHLKHAEVISPGNGLTLDSAVNRSACYQCHPGSTTQCLRGVMGGAIDQKTGGLSMQCQSCHGGMSVVGAKTRTGWLDEPSCQACHTGTATKNSGQIRYSSVFTATGEMRQPADARFASNPDTPMAGKSLYRFSKGHGGLQCSACHGSTHAEFPSVHTNDNLNSINLQGHKGVLVECMACHKQMPETVAGGPHGLHPVGAAWVDHHGDAAKKSTHGECQSCHGATNRGSVLARAKAPRTFSHDGKTMKFWSGQTMGCYECHNGPSGEGAAPTAPTVSASLALTVAAGVTSVTKTVATTPSKGVTLRVVDQPQHGTAAVNGTTIVYYPFTGYTGADTFTYAVSNGTRESNLGKAAVTIK